MKLVPFAFRVVNWLAFDDGGTVGAGADCPARRTSVALGKDLRGQRGTFVIKAVPTPATPPSAKRTRSVLEPEAEHTLRIERRAAESRTSDELQTRRGDRNLKAASRRCAQRQQHRPGGDSAAGAQHPPTCWIAGVSSDTAAGERLTPYLASRRANILRCRGGACEPRRSSVQLT
jgi:hypothetical protein